MKALTGWLYGHYDSRGGSAFVQAATQEEADQKYAYHFYTEEFIKELEQEEWWTSLTDYLNEDRIRAVTLHVPDDFDLDGLNGADLENHDMKAEQVLADRHGGRKGQAYWAEAATLPPLGAVLAQGGYTDRAAADEEADTEFFDGESANLEFVPTGRQPQVLQKFSHPRWNDDAYSFVFLK